MVFKRRKMDGRQGWRGYERRCRKRMKPVFRAVSFLLWNLPRVPPTMHGRGNDRVAGRKSPSGRGVGCVSYVALEIVVPPADTPEAESLYRKMAGSMPFEPRAGFPA